MKVVVADTSPLNYLVLIDCIELLRRLYGQIVIPVQVFDELTASGAPTQVAAWIRAQPAWVEIRPVPGGVPFNVIGLSLDDGEIAAIQIALAEHDSLLLIDETAGRSAASRLGVANTGTLGVLAAGAKAGLVDLKTALDGLRKTNFRISQSLIDNLLANQPPIDVS